MRELGALIKRHRNDQDWQNWRAGMIAATIANVNRDPKHTPHAYQPQDFMPLKEGEKPQVKRRKQTPEEMEQIVIMWNAALGGEDRRRLN